MSLKIFVYYCSMLPQIHILTVTNIETDNIVYFLGKQCWIRKHDEAIIIPIRTVLLLSTPLVHLLNK